MTGKPKAPAPPQRITRFTKIRFDGKKVRLEYHVTRPGGGDPDEFVVNCGDKPLVAFDEALQALVSDVCFICEFPFTEAERITVRGVSLAYTDGVMGATLTALRKLDTADAPLVLNSPFLPETVRESDKGGFRLPAVTVRRIRALIDEAERYLRGTRAQGSLLEDVEGDDRDRPSTPPPADGHEDAAR